MRPSIGFGSIGIINLANPKVMIIWNAVQCKVRSVRVINC